MGSNLSNIEPLARAIAERAYRKCDAESASNSDAARSKRDAWVDAHWECAAAELEAGLLDDDGDPVPGADWERGLAAYRERISARPQPSN